MASANEKFSVFQRLIYIAIIRIRARTLQRRLSQEMQKNIRISRSMSILEAECLIGALPDRQLMNQIT